MGKEIKGWPPTKRTKQKQGADSSQFDFPAPHPLMALIYVVRLISANSHNGNSINMAMSIYGIAVWCVDPHVIICTGGEQVAGRDDVHLSSRVVATAECGTRLVAWEDGGLDDPRPMAFGRQTPAQKTIRTVLRRPG
jgi:hypothetical protein